MLSFAAQEAGGLEGVDAGVAEHHDDVVHGLGPAGRQRPALARWRGWWLPWCSVSGRACVLGAGGQTLAGRPGSSSNRELSVPSGNQVSVAEGTVGKVLVSPGASGWPNPRDRTRRGPARPADGPAGRFAALVEEVLQRHQPVEVRRVEQAGERPPPRHQGARGPPPRGHAPADQAGQRQGARARTAPSSQLSDRDPLRSGRPARSRRAGRRPPTGPAAGPRRLRSGAVRRRTRSPGRGAGLVASGHGVGQGDHQPQARYAAPALASVFPPGASTEISTWLELRRTTSTAAATRGATSRGTLVLPLTGNSDPPSGSPVLSEARESAARQHVQRRRGQCQLPVPERGQPGHAWRAGPGWPAPAPYRTG